MVAPAILLPWKPAEVARAFNHGTEAQEEFAGTVADTAPGERGLIYQTTVDQGIVAFIDFVSAALPHPDLGFAAWGTSRALRQPVGRVELLDLDRTVFTRPRGRRRLTQQLSHALDRRLGLPKRSIAKPLEFSPDEMLDIQWNPAGLAASWGIESAMRDAIATHRPSWARLGFAAAPRREVHVPGSLDRMDLFGDGVIAECKLDAGIASLVQLDRYLTALRAYQRRTRWRGHLIVARSYSREVARLVQRRRDVDLWTCHRRPDGLPDLCREV